MTDFLDPAVLNATLQAAKAWGSHFSELGAIAGNMTLRHDASAFDGAGADVASIVVNGVSIEATQWAANDIRFSAEYPGGRSVSGDETFFEQTDGRGGLFGVLRTPEPDVEAHSALNALLVLATMKAIADAVTHKTFDEIRGAGGIDTPTGRLTSFNRG